MDNKKIIASLIKIANNQQKIIAKLAQQIGTDPNRVMEGKLRATFQRLVPQSKLTNVRVDGMSGPHPEAHIEGEGVEPNQVKSIATETFLLDNKVPTVYFNGNALTSPKAPAKL